MWLLYILVSVVAASERYWPENTFSLPKQSRQTVTSRSLSEQDDAVVRMSLSPSRFHRVAITQAKPDSTNWAVAHHVYYMYDSIDRLPDWEPYLIISGYRRTSIEVFGRNYRTTNMGNMSGFTVGIASAMHATFPKHMTSIAHIQGAEYMNMAKYIRFNASYAFGVNQTYDAMWLLPHHAWQGPFLAERNRIEHQRECPYVWSPRILQHRGKYAYKPNTAGNIGVFETNNGLYKMSYIPLLILNRLARQHPELIQWWETYGLQPVSNVEFQKFLLSLREAIVRPFNVSMLLADIPSDFKKHDIGTVLSHQFTVGLNNIYFEALYMNMSWVHNSPYFRDCGYYYDGFDVEAGARALEEAIRTHDTHLDTYAERATTCIRRHDPLRTDNFLAFKVLLDEWIPPSPIVLAAQKMQKRNINVMYAVNMVSMVRSWLCNTAGMHGVHEKTLIIVDDASYNELRSMDLRITLVRDSNITGSYLPYGTYGYWQLVQRRLHIFGDLIRSGQNIFIVEPDAWWATDPTLSIESNEADVVGFENSERVFGFGFLHLKSSPTLVRLWTETEWVVDTAMGAVQPPTSRFTLTPMAHEQIAFSRLLQQTNLTTFVLDACQFPSGRWYSDNDYRARCPTPSVIQNNYIAGFEQKIQRAKAWHHWFDNCDSVETAPEPYFTYRIPPHPDYKETPLHYIHTFKLIRPEACDFIKHAALAYVKVHDWATKRHKSYPTTDIAVRKTPLWPEVSSIIKAQVFPTMSRYYHIPLEFLSIRDLFICQYDADTPNRQHKLNWHRDGSVLSFVVLLNEPSEFKGGATQFHIKNGSVPLQSKGDIIMFSGRLAHSVEIESGKRYVLTGFVGIDDSFINQTVFNETRYSNLDNHIDYNAVSNILSKTVPPEKPIVKKRIPRIVWTYWHSEEMPPLVISCIKTWSRFLKGWDIRIVHKESVSDYLNENEDFPPTLWEEPHIPHQADMIRFALVRKYGGFWLDATTIIRANMLDTFRDRTTDWFGYGGETPEIFAFASPKGGRTITKFHKRMLRVMNWGRDRTENLKNVFNISSDYLFPQQLLNITEIEHPLPPFDTAYNLIRELRNIQAVKTKRQFYDLLFAETSKLPPSILAQPLLKLNYCEDIDPKNALPASWWNQLTASIGAPMDLKLRTKASLVNGHVSLQSNMYRYVGYLTCDTWVVGVLSAPNDVEQRNWFRKTHSGSYVFLIGSHSTGGGTDLAVDQAQELKTEMSEHQDIVIFGLREQYNQSLTQKVQGFFQVVLQQCPETQFVIKTDHDVWFDFNNVRREVEELDSPVYYGRVLTNQPVYKDTQSKYYDPTFPEDTYPPYVSGWGYVLDRAAVQIVVAQKDTLLRSMEDVHTGLLLRDVTPVMSYAFQGNVAKQGYLRGTPAFKNSSTHFGGIGNRLFFWASAVGLAKHANLMHCVTPNGPDLWLSKVFDMDLGPMCTDSTPKKVHSTLHQTHESLDLSIRRVNGMAVESIQLGGYFQSFKYFQDIDIRPQLRFSASVREAVSLIFAHRIPQARHYVGIHVRRGDALRAGDRRFPPAEYFVQAMAHYRATLGNDITFVVASDDRAWCRKQFFFRDAHILDDSYSDVLDLALLANSNHTIMSTGTFGWWAAWLANGQTIYYADEFDEQHTNNKIVLDDYYPPQWIPLRPQFYQISMPSFYIYEELQFNKSISCTGAAKQLQWLRQVNVEDEMLFEQLSTHPQRTYDPDTAEVFIIPYLFAKEFECNPYTYTKRLEGAFEALVSQKSFQRNYGHDHLMGTFDYVFNAYWKLANMMVPRELSKHLANVTATRYEIHNHEILHNDIFRPKSDNVHTTSSLVVPYALKTDTNTSNIPWSMRPIRVWYYTQNKSCVTEYQTKLRHRPFLQETWSGQNLDRVGFTIPAEEWNRGWPKSRYCLVIRGDTPTSHALYHAVAHGCIPVIISDYIQHVGIPFGIDVDAFSVRVSEQAWMRDGMHAVIRMLEKNPVEKLSALARVRPFMLWEHPQSRVIEQIIQYVHERKVLHNPEPSKIQHSPTFTTRYINIERRRDRRDHIETILADFEYKRHNATYLPAYGALGAAYSHKSVLEQYMATCAPCVPLLIVEDDIEWSVQKAREEIQRTIHNLKHWDVLMLSANPGGAFRQTNTPHVLRVESAQTASAYLINTHYQQTLLDNFKESVQLLEQRGHPKQDERVVTPQGVVWNTDTLCIDQHWKRLQKNDIWFFRPMATHIMTLSDIYNITTDYK